MIAVIIPRLTASLSQSSSYHYSNTPYFIFTSFHLSFKLTGTFANSSQTFPHTTTRFQILPHAYKASNQNLSIPVFTRNIMSITMNIFFLSYATITSKMPPFYSNNLTRFTPIIQSLLPLLLFLICSLFCPLLLDSVLWMLLLPLINLSG